MERGLIDRTEAEIGAFVVARMREEGAEPSFPPIVASGPNGASPHAEPGPRVIGKHELVTIDMGATLDGYCSDCTRTFATGMLEEKAGRDLRGHPGGERSRPRGRPAGCRRRPTSTRPPAT